MNVEKPRRNPRRRCIDSGEQPANSTTTDFQERSPRGHREHAHAAPAHQRFYHLLHLHLLLLPRACVHTLESERSPENASGRMGGPAGRRARRGGVVKNPRRVPPISFYFHAAPLRRLFCWSRLRENSTETPADFGGYTSGLIAAGAERVARAPLRERSLRWPTDGRIPFPIVNKRRVMGGLRFAGGRETRERPGPARRCDPRSTENRRTVHRDRP